MPRDEVDALRDALARRALLFPPGREFFGSPPSVFGRVTHALPGESWPWNDGVPLCPLLQLNLSELPYLPPLLADVTFLTLFIHPQTYPEDDENGSTWCLRAYRSMTDLVPLSAPELDWAVKEVPLGPPSLVDDYPCYESLEQEYDDDLWDAFAQKYPTREGVKLGGWPSLIQAELVWAPFGRHSAQPEYVLQVDSLEQAGWSWGDGGCAYLGRGTASGRESDWALQWQCY